MRRLPLVTLFITALMVFPSSADAMPVGGGNVLIKVGDAVDVVATKLACYAVKASGKAGVVCFKLDAKGLDPGTFGVGIAQDGTVTAYKVNAKREPQRILKREPQSAAAPMLDLAAAKTIHLRTGSTFQLKKTKVLCQILTVTGGVAPLYRGTKVGCFRADGVGPLPRSNGVVISNKFIGAFAFKSNRKPGASFFERAQP